MVDKIISFIKKTITLRCFIYLCYVIGKNFLFFIESLGRFCIFFYTTSLSIFKKRFFLKNTLNSFYVNGICSILVISITGVFIGAVLTLQLFITMSSFGISDNIPYIVLIALMKELSPVICGLMVVARVGSSMSAEIGSMSVNNQLDALMSMSISKYKFLYLPRIISMIVVQPLLTTIGIITGLMGCFFITTSYYNYSSAYFFNIIAEGFELHAYIISIIKSIVFGLILSLIACYEGDKTKDGFSGIRKATTSSVVLSCVYILLSNFLITFLIDN